MLIEKVLSFYDTIDFKSFMNWGGYLGGAVLVAIATVLGNLSVIALHTNAVVIAFYLLCVVITALYGGFGPAVFVSISSVLVNDYLFVDAPGEFGSPDAEDISILIILLMVSVVASYLAARTRMIGQRAQQSQLETQTLYEVSKKLASTDELDASVTAIKKSISDTLGHDVTIFLPDPQKNNLLTPSPNSNKQEDIVAVNWTFQNQKRAGRDTTNFPDSESIYIPLLTVRGAVGVMVTSTGKVLNAEQQRLLEGFADLASVAIERITFAKEAQNIKISQAATEKLQVAFIDSISHDLRTPITSIIGVFSGLQAELGLGEAEKKRLIQVAGTEAGKLNNLITNLLDISRIQAGAIVINKQSCDVNDLVSVVLDRIENHNDTGNIEINIPPDLPLINADFNMIVKVLLNLVDNAIKYSPTDSPIEIRARDAEAEVEISVLDHGVGIPPQDMQFLFGRFYRVPNTTSPGIGLGLSICKGIVEAHGGRIIAANRAEGGTIISIFLSIDAGTRTKKEIENER